jgi:hypothetical protein
MGRAASGELQACFAGCDDRLRSVQDAEIGEDDEEVVGNRFRADPEATRNRCVAVAVGEQGQDLALPWRELGQGLERRSGRLGF